LTGGIAACGRCGHALIAQVRPRAGGKTVSTYGCSSVRGGCDGLSIIAEPFEAVVVERLMEHLDDPEFRAVLAAGDVDADRREALERQKVTVEARRTEASLAVVQGAMSPKMAGLVEQGIDDELARIDEQIGQLTPVQVSDLDPDKIKADWDGLDLAEKRAILTRLDCSVMVAPATTTRTFNPARVTVAFRRDGEHVPGAGSPQPQS
jgi:site-specific DNA recombinase